jgi:hypothetical protein
MCFNCPTSTSFTSSIYCEGHTTRFQNLPTSKLAYVSVNVDIRISIKTGLSMVSVVLISCIKSHIKMFRKRLLSFPQRMKR